MGKFEAFTGDQAFAEAMRQINPDVVAAYPITPQTETVEFFAEFPVVAFLCFFQPEEIIIKFLLRRECNAVNSLKHGIFFVSTPISSGNFGQFKCIGIYFFCCFSRITSAALSPQRMTDITIRKQTPLPMKKNKSIQVIIQIFTSDFKK